MSAKIERYHRTIDKKTPHHSRRRPRSEPPRVAAYAAWLVACEPDG